MVILNFILIMEFYYINVVNFCNFLFNVYFYVIFNEFIKYIYCDDFGDVFEKMCLDNKVWNEDVL